MNYPYGYPLLNNIDDVNYAIKTAWSTAIMDFKHNLSCKLFEINRNSVAGMQLEVNALISKHLLLLNSMGLDNNKSICIPSDEDIASLSSNNTLDHKPVVVQSEKIISLKKTLPTILRKHNGGYLRIERLSTAVVQSFIQVLCERYNISEEGLLKKYESQKVNNSLRAAFELLKENSEITQDLLDKLIEESVSKINY
jgi:hypothetical protein